MAEQRSRFVGIYEHGVDDKGRMVLPSRVRAQLGETGMLGMLDDCLGLWTVEGFDTVSDELLARVAADEVTMNAFRTFTAYAAEISPDAQGRVVIPQRLRDYAGITNEVVINGRVDRAEIWDKAAWDANAPAGDAELKQAVRDLRI
jgi:MraZ protein